MTRSGRRSGASVAHTSNHEEFFARLYELCLLRAGPQDVPSARIVPLFAGAIYILVGAGVALSNYPPGQALAWSALDTLLLGMLAHISLLWRGKRLRFPQTFSALAGSGALLSLCSWPVLLMLLRLPENDPRAALPSLLLVVGLIWSIVVIAHILRHALSSSYAAGLLLALLYVIVSWNLSGLLFAPPAH